jgi:hypothetical protein
MLASVLLTVVLAAPAVAEPPVQPDRRELGPLWLDQSSKLTWPGLYLPSFTLAPDRRRVHRLTLGLELPILRGLSFDVVVVEPSDDPDILARTSHLRTGEGSAHAWLGIRYQLPKSRWQLNAGYATTVRRAGAMGRPGGWSINLVRPLR